jgi:hypothetical protein
LKQVDAEGSLVSLSESNFTIVNFGYRFPKPINGGLSQLFNKKKLLNNINFLFVLPSDKFDEFLLVFWGEFLELTPEFFDIIF